MQVSMLADDIKKARDGQGQILFWGTAEYSDVFEPKKLHHISICTMLKTHALLMEKPQFSRCLIAPIAIATTKLSADISVPPEFSVSLAELRRELFGMVQENNAQSPLAERCLVEMTSYATSMAALMTSRAIPIFLQVGRGPLFGSS
jgi:hypothetical protein